MSYQHNQAKHYTYPELLTQIRDVKRHFPATSGGIKKGAAELILPLRPTENSIKYTVKLCAKLGSKSVRIFVIEPKIERIEQGKAVPHLYKDQSLCLFYPPYNEWVFSDSWAETIIPWASLWLFYYEIWQETGLWLGGGIHGKKTVPIS